MSDIIKKLVQRKNRNYKDILNFVVCFEEISRIEILWEHGIFGMILFTFRVIFYKIMIFLIKILIQNYISRQNWINFEFHIKRKAIKKTSSDLIGIFTIKKFELFYLRALFK